MATIAYRGRYVSAINTYSDITGQPFDAAAVSVILRAPDGTEAGPFTPEHLDGSGFYSKVFFGDDTSDIGTYKAIWTITGNQHVAATTHVDSFDVSSAG